MKTCGTCLFYQSYAERCYNKESTEHRGDLMKRTDYCKDWSGIDFDEETGDEKIYTL
jgi:hypothetical protein